MTASPLTLDPDIALLAAPALNENLQHVVRRGRDTLPAHGAFATRFQFSGHETAGASRGTALASLRRLRDAAPGAVTLARLEAPLGPIVLVGRLDLFDAIGGPTCSHPLVEELLLAIAVVRDGAFWDVRSDLFATADAELARELADLFANQ